MWRADNHKPAYDIGVQRRDRPRDEPTPTVPDDNRVTFTECGDQPSHVGSERRQVVTARWLVARAVTAQVRRNGTQPVIGQPHQLVTPAPPELREAVQKDDKRTGPRLRDMKAVTPGAYVAMRPRSVDENGRRVLHVCQRRTCPQQRQPVRVPFSRRG